MPKGYLYTKAKPGGLSKEKAKRTVAPEQEYSGDIILISEPKGDVVDLLTNSVSWVVTYFLSPQILKLKS